MNGIAIHRWVPVEDAERAASLDGLGTDWTQVRPVEPDDRYPGRVTVVFARTIDEADVDALDVSQARAELGSRVDAALAAAGIDQAPRVNGIVIGDGPVPPGMRRLVTTPVVPWLVGRWMSWDDTDRAIRLPGLGTRAGHVVDPPPSPNRDLALVAFVFEFREVLTAEMRLLLTSHIDTSLAGAGITAEEYDGELEPVPFDPSPAGAHRRSTPLVVARELRVFPDWGHRWPLWETGTHAYANQPELYGLSPELTDALRAWYDEWERTFDADSGWPDHETQERSTVELHRLADAIRAEIGSWIRVRV